MVGVLQRRPADIAEVTRQTAQGRSLGGRPGDEAYEQHLQKLVDELPPRVRGPVIVELRGCKGCGAEQGEPCRWGCLSHETR